MSSRGRLFQERLVNERLFQERLQQEEAERASRERRAKEDEAIAAELARQRSEDERKRCEIRRVCDDSPELRELERALKLAYLSKDRAVQAQEKVYLAEWERERLRLMEEYMEHERVRSALNERDRDAEKRAMQEQQRRCWTSSSRSGS